VFYDPITSLAESYQAGGVTDLAAALKDTDHQVDDLVAAG
jgi:hypothetical protein